MPSIPQIVFTIIFPLAVLITLTGWTVVIITFIRRIRSGKDRSGSYPRRYYIPRRRRARPRSAWELALSTLPRSGRYITPLQ